MVLTPEILRAAYAYLAVTPPFDKWNLPDAEDVRFVVQKNRPGHHGICNRWEILERGKVLGMTFEIGINGASHTYTSSLLVTMAHEMVHVHEYQTGLRVTSAKHGKVFRALACEVCAAHGFDPGQF
jgi:hypothetical protein